MFMCNSVELVVNENCHFVAASLLTSHPGLKMNAVPALLVVVDMGSQAVAVALIVPIVGGMQVDLELL